MTDTNMNEGGCRRCDELEDKLDEKEKWLVHARAQASECCKLELEWRRKWEDALSRLDASESMLKIWRDAEAKRREVDHFEIRLDGNNELDEIVGAGMFHLEQMDSNEWFLELGGCAMWISGKRVELIPRDHEDWPKAQKSAGVERHVPQNTIEAAQHLLRKIQKCRYPIVNEADPSGPMLMCDQPLGHDGPHTVIV